MTHSVIRCTNYNAAIAGRSSSPTTSSTEGLDVLIAEKNTS